MPKKAAKKAVKKTTRTSTVKKAVAKKVAAKKTATRKVAAKKTVSKKVAPKTPATKKVATRKVVAKKVVAKKVARKKTATRTTPVVTTIIAKINAGYGNDLYIRGGASGLTWDTGVLMKNTLADEWVWTSETVTGELEFKVLLNDSVWAGGPNGVIFPGATVVFEPLF